MAHELKAGQRVKFYRTHDKQTPLTGVIVDADQDEPLVIIKTDEGNGSMSRIEEAHPSDVTVVAGEAAKTESKPAGNIEWVRGDNGQWIPAQK